MKPRVSKQFGHWRVDSTLFTPTIHATWEEARDAGNLRASAILSIVPRFVFEAPFNPALLRSMSQHPSQWREDEAA